MRTIHRFGISSLLAIEITLTASCGVGPDGPSTQVADLKAGSPTPTTVQKGSVAIGVDTPFDVAVSPGAVCTLGVRGVPASDPPLRVYADDRGLVRLSVHPTADEGATGAIELDCEGADGTRATHAVELSAVHAEATIFGKSGVRSTPHAGLVRPALGDEAISWTPKELTAHGYPLRPDPVATPGAYALWREAVSRPSTRVGAIDQPVFERHSASHRPKDMITVEGTTNWSGMVATAASGDDGLPATPFTAVFGAWYVPSVTTQVILASSTMWVGLDGWTAEPENSIIQCGTNQSAVLVPFFGSVGSYSAWIEYVSTGYQSVGQTILGPVSPGDLIFAESWVGDADGTVDVLGQYGWYFIEELTAGFYFLGGVFVAALPEPANATFYGVNAEWIMERGPAIEASNGSVSYPPLADFGTTTMFGTSAYTSNGWLPMNSYPTLTNLNILSSIFPPHYDLVVAIPGYDEINFTWFAPF
jgi:hypothetical protein